jgi:hypothetical protein
VQKIAAVSQMNSHFPIIGLKRCIVKKNWQVVTRIECSTMVLGGLSAHDFHLAMVRAHHLSWCIARCKYER